MNHTTTTKTLAIVVVLMLASISAATTALIGAAAITTKDPTILDFENSATNYSSEQKEKNNCSSSGGGSDTQCTNDATQQSTRSREPEREPETTGTLLIKKVCPRCIPNPVLKFSVEITAGNNPQPSTFNINPDSSQLVTLGPGTFTIVEHAPFSVVSPTFSGDCMQTAPGSPEATGTISAGQHLTCTITNTIIQ